QQVLPAEEAVALLQHEPGDVAPTNVLRDEPCRLRVHSEPLQRGAAELQGRFEGLADLEVDLPVHERDRVRSVDGAYEGAGAGEFGMDDLGDLQGGGRIVDADADDIRRTRAGRAQHVEARAVAVIDLEAEAGSAADAVDVAVDHRHVGPVG